MLAVKVQQKHSYGRKSWFLLKTLETKHLPCSNRSQQQPPPANPPHTGLLCHSHDKESDKSTLERFQLPSTTHFLVSSELIRPCGVVMKLWQAVNSSPVTAAEVCTTLELFLMGCKDLHTCCASGHGLCHMEPLDPSLDNIFLYIVVVCKQQELLWKVLKLASYFSKSHLSHHIKAQKRGTALTTVLQTNSNIQMESYICGRYLQCICFPGKGFSDQFISSHKPVLSAAKKTDWPNWLKQQEFQYLQWWL